MKLHIRYIDTDPFYEVDCVPEIGCDTIQIIATDPYRFTADGWRVNVTQDEDAGLLAVASMNVISDGNLPPVSVRVNPHSVTDSLRLTVGMYQKEEPHRRVYLSGSVGEELARWEIK